MGRISSMWFTRLWAYKRRNTLAPDTWFSALHQALANAGTPPKRFVPIVGGDDQARIDRNAAAAEEAMDAGL